MRIVRLLAIFAAALALGAAASAQLVSGYGAAWYGPLTPPFYGVGGYTGYNAANASDYDFYNVGAGPFYWYSLGSGQTLPSSPSMILNGTTLTVTQVKGNASTATALAATPTQCGTGSYATGIQSNGDANCSAAGGPSIQTIQVTGTSEICTTGTAAFSQCAGSSPVTWTTAFADTNYSVSCMGASAMTGTITQIWATSITASGFTLNLQNGDSNGAVASTFTQIDCMGIHN
jgi:hypothetical protein